MSGRARTDPGPQALCSPGKEAGQGWAGPGSPGWLVPIPNLTSSQKGHGTHVLAAAWARAAGPTVPRRVIRDFKVKGRNSTQVSCLPARVRLGGNPASSQRNPGLQVGIEVGRLAREEESRGQTWAGEEGARHREGSGDG